MSRATTSISLQKRKMEKANHTWPKLAHLTDRYGNSFQYGNAGDYWHPAFPIGQDTDYRTHVRRIRDMVIRPDDVLISSFPKTGLHWHFELVSMLMIKTSQYIHIDNFDPAFLDFTPASQIDQLPSPRLLITHVPFRYFPKQAFQKKVKIIRLERNPKDVLVSLHCHLSTLQPPLEFPGTLYHMFRLYFDNGFLYGDLFDYLMDWQEGLVANSDVDVFTSVYEDMKENTLQGIINLNDYIGTGCSQDLCAEITKACTFEKIKPAKNDEITQYAKAFFKEGSSTFYRKGQVGNWKNWFTVAMNEEFDEEYKKRMSGFKRQYRYTLE